MLTLDKQKLELMQAKKGLSSSNLVKASDITQQTLSNIRKGKPCKPQTIHALCKALECDPTDLMD